MQDILEDIFRMIELKSCLYFQQSFHAPWAMAIDASEVAQFHIVVDGSAVLEVGGRTWMLQAGDLLLFPHGEAHVLADRAGRTPLSGRAVLDGLANGRPPFAEGEQATCLICGHYEYRRHANHPLVEGLPDQILLRARQSQDVDQDILALLIKESAKRGPGSGVVVERLAEVLLIQILRSYALQDRSRVAFLAGAMEPRLSRAIARIHRNPDEPLVLGDLATTAGMSRTAFAEQFRRKTGLAPIAYLTKWRMLSAEQLLGDRSLSIPEIASRVGYESEIAFARAFKREFGTTPAGHRRAL